MTIRNLSPDLANGTKLIIKNMFEHIIEAEIINGPGKGKTVTIPRITFIEPF